MSRGIVSIFWGDKSKLPIERLRASIKKYHPELPHEIVQVQAPGNDASSYNQKAAMYELSPFDETLFLDVDTVVMGKLDYGFEMARTHGLALAICECPWARRYSRIFDGDQIEYNTGVVFFTKKALPVFEKWKAIAGSVDSSITFVDANGNFDVMTANDQGSFALAIEETKFNPYVLPLNWNFRPTWYRSFFGPIKIWHDYSEPLQIIKKLNEYYEMKNSVIQYFQLA